jgi:hypothetical protein
VGVQVPPPAPWIIRLDHKKPLGNNDARLTLIQDSGFFNGIGSQRFFRIRFTLRVPRRTASMRIGSTSG